MRLHIPSAPRARLIERPRARGGFAPVRAPVRRRRADRPDLQGDAERSLFVRMIKQFQFCASETKKHVNPIARARSPRDKR